MAVFLSVIRAQIYFSSSFEREIFLFHSSLNLMLHVIINEFEIVMSLFIAFLTIFSLRHELCSCLKKTHLPWRFLEHLFCKCGINQCVVQTNWNAFAHVQIRKNPSILRLIMLLGGNVSEDYED